jgi:type II secretory pathway component PulM
MSTLHAFADYWSKRSPREQALALAVAALATLLVLAIGIQQARATLLGLDRDIERLSNDLINSHYQLARRESVDARFARVAAQHSSAWSESEIRDRLRQEIYRLANRVPPKLDGNGIPVSTTGEGGALVSIPKLGQGRLEAGGEGFREYQISVHIPAVPIYDMLAFLERLQGSPQSLRLDRIDMRRDPARSAVSADVDITRIVVDTQALPGDSSSPNAEQDMALNPDDWEITGCTSTLDANGALAIRASTPNATAWLARSLPAGAGYDLHLDLEATGHAEIAIGADGQVFTAQDSVILDDSAGLQSVHLRFTVPNNGKSRAQVQTPFIQIQDAGTTLRIKRIRIHRGAQS